MTACKKDTGKPEAALVLLAELHPWEVVNSLRPGTLVHSFQVRSSQEKEALIRALEDSVPGEDAEHELLRQKGALLVDELLENALYGAPRSVDGGKLFRRGERRDLLPGESITLSFGFDGETLALKLTDSWGNLEPEVVLAHLARNLEGGWDGETVGGRGLFIIWNFLDQLHLAVKPGRQTAVGGHLTLGSGLQPQSQHGIYLTQLEREGAAWTP